MKILRLKVDKVASCMWIVSTLRIDSPHLNFFFLKKKQKLNKIKNKKNKKTKQKRKKTKENCNAMYVPSFPHLH
jgi:hypothetical protein